MAKRPVDEMMADAREVYGVFDKPDKALSIVNRALELEPENVEALNLKAAILYELDKDDEARDYHQRALAIEPNSVEALHGLASIANDSKEYQQALTVSEKALAAIPNDPYTEFRENEDYRQRLIAEVYCERAFAVWYLNNREEAVQLLTEEAPNACPLEIETFEDQLDWLQHHPESPEE